MKVLIITKMYPNSQVFLSGIFVHEQVKALIKLGVQVEVLALIPFSPPIIRNFKNKWRLFHQIPRIEIIENVKVYHPRFWAIPKGFLKAYWPYPSFLLLSKFFKDVKLKLDDFDILHVQGTLPEDYIAYLLAKKINKPLVLTVHGSSVYAIVKNKKQFQKSKRVILKANAVIAVSQKVKERIVKFTGRIKNVFVIYNGFTNIILPERRKKDDNVIKILFGATLIKRKGCEYLIKAFADVSKNHNNVELWIAGGGELFNELKDLAKMLGVFNKTKFFGAIEHSKMLELMNNCDIFALPSWDEAFGVVYLEAMSFKKPVIGTENEGVSEIIIDGTNGLLVPPRNVNILKNKLEMLVTDENLREKIGKKGFETAKKFTWERNAKRNLEVYEDVLKDLGNN
jgi:teichuronic acid biosynthesis glycosyltransferase TuaC